MAILMKTAVEKSGSINGYDYLVLFYKDGHRCGYVRVPDWHPFHSNYHGDIPVCCHGGLTFSAQVSKEEKGFSTGFWIGFDCAHGSDGRDFNRARELFGSSSQIDMMEKHFGVGLGTVRSLDYVEGQCAYIIDQLVELEKYNFDQRIQQQHKDGGDNETR